MCCGAQFTSKMEGMLNDLSIGADHQRDFVESLRNRQEELKVFVIGPSFLVSDWALNSSGFSR
jgi:cullin 1